ncbi:hypothetical protein CLAFUW4_10409 [Fulvia fulva]|uniref:Uncharacterized protein n=1 Tax=Passalora fulva TaxID=5499 RepID=A0A9Q8LFM0_PASFU|nr:uncharacterized protein CLAFUR5_05024 [Fulvia fulva]KAK4616051.1 hypothetical protein CLAFUR4_10413 [Fulvia fulva]KAK4617314.1 hypothetical protein CLAFUR0_10414 [Fulvia fulva]UJO15758.1 hypothetical protein CLAFUR5_05024 [Fulvia fulva]WPV18938.1 hypothetical protein CLAFUW4_10409 [Fulvia fulva]WPV34222.1 hypothetical protein CLAFUW7_10409 [Fulvia fulva]
MSTTSYQLRTTTEIMTDLSEHAWRVIGIFVEPLPQPQPVIEEIPPPAPVSVILSPYEQAWQTAREWMDSEDAPFIMLASVLAVFCFVICILSYHLNNTGSRLRSLESLVAHLQAHVANLKAGHQPQPDDTPDSSEPEPHPDSESTPQPEPVDEDAANNQPQYEFLKDHYIQWDFVDTWREIVLDTFTDYSKCKFSLVLPSPTTLMEVSALDLSVTSSPVPCR